jgi:hypothetical protein
MQLDVRLRLQFPTVIPNAEVVKRRTKQTGWRISSTNVLTRWSRYSEFRDSVLMTEE